MIVLFNDSPQYPNRSVGVYRIATALRRHGLDVEVIDYMTGWEKSGSKLLFEYLDRIDNVEWWGFSGRFNVPQDIMVKDAPKQTWFVGSVSSTIEFENDLLSYVRNRGGKIVLGGPNAYILKNSLPEGYIDYLCQGYSDLGVIAIHEHITRGTSLIHETHKDFIVVDCDENYNDVSLTNIDVEYHESDFISDGEVFPIEISRGCIFSCAFCSYPHNGKAPGTYIRPKESIKKDIVDRYTKYGTTRFLFVDDTFNDSIDKMKIIRDIRIETGIPFVFWSYGRLDLLRAQPEMVDLITETGWRSFTFGVETFNRRSGSAIGKGADPEKLKQFLIDFRARFPDIHIMIHFIIGLPNDTEESVLETYQWFIDNTGIVDHLVFQKLIIQKPHYKKITSKLTDNPEKYGYTTIPNQKKIIAVNWMNNTGMSQKRASELTQEIQENVSKNFKPTNYDRSMIPKEQWVTDDSGKFRIDSTSVVRRYIDNKLRYRGILR
jgi:radical SAM superfamily enzyme YgiQ (UPF0313 family)